MPNKFRKVLPIKPITLKRKYKYKNNLTNHQKNYAIQIAHHPIIHQNYQNNHQN
jgi:hypothetical protein